MTRPDRTISISFKLFLAFLAAVFAAAAVILIDSLTTAATPTGSVPALAVSLIHGANTGILGPGSQRWFKFTPDKAQQAGQIEQSLTLFFTPNYNQHTKQVALQLYKADQVPLFDLNSPGKMTNLGAGQIVSRDPYPETGELFWTGWLAGQESYYIQLVNSSDDSIDYWLFDETVYQLESGQAKPLPAPDFTPGAAPQTALSLAFGQTKGNLAAGQEIWYSFSVNDLDGEGFAEMALTLFTTPDNGQRLQRMNFDLFTASEIRFWSPGAGSKLHNFGAGSIVQRDNNPLTGERFWSGWLVKQDLYYLRIRNSNDIPMDYWLFTADIYQPNLE